MTLTTMMTMTTAIAPMVNQTTRLLGFSCQSSLCQAEAAFRLRPQW